MSASAASPTRRSWAVAGLVAVVALLVRLPIMIAGADTQLSLMADDASYYLEAARRTAETGAWPSLDGTNPTNGFHPLYFVLVLGLNQVAGGETGRIVPLVLGCNLLLNVAGIVLLVVLLRGHLEGMGGIAAGVLLGLSPGWMAHAFACVENGISSLLALLVVSRWISRFDPGAGFGLRSPPADRGWSVDGAILGLAMLARTDAAILAAVYLASAAIMRRREPVATVARDLVTCGAVAALVVTPWLACNLWRFGTIAQDSAVSLSVRFARLDGDVGSMSRLVSAARNAFFWVYRLGWSWGLIPLTFFLLGLVAPLQRTRRAHTHVAGAVLLVACAAAVAIRANDAWYIDAPRWAAVELALGAGALVLGAVTRRPAGPFAPSTLAFLAAWTAALVAAYAAGLGAFQLWYTTGPTLGAVLLLTLPMLAAWLRVHRWLAVLLTVLMLGQAGLKVSAYLTRGAIEGLSPRLLADGVDLRLRLELASASRPTRFAAFDSGELSFRVHPFPILNADGVMNHAAARAIVTNTLAAYLARNGVTHVVTPEDRLREFQRVSPFAFEPDPEMSRLVGQTVFRLDRPPGR